MKVINWGPACVLACLTLSCGADFGAEPIGSSEEAITTGSISRLEFLFPENILYSPNCAFYARMQQNGSLVIRETATGHWFWSSGTDSQWAFGDFQSDGNFVILTRDSLNALWATGGASAAVTFAMEDSGQLVARASNGSVTWSSNSRRTPVGSCQTLGPVYSEAMDVVRSTDRPGGDMPNMPIAVQSWSHCASFCSTNPSCQAFTFAPGGTCWLKNVIPAAVAHTGLSSGIKVRARSGVPIIPVP